jgi:hypothetical protein
LLDLLRNEKLHPAPERAGDLVQIYEALGATRDPRAAAALERELLDPAVGKAPKVAAVEALAAIGAPSSVEALSALRDHLEVTLETDPYEQELRRDLLDAIGRATG